MLGRRSVRTRTERPQAHRRRLLHQDAFRQAGIDLKLWIQKENSLPHKLVVTALPDEAAPGDTLPALKFRIRLRWIELTPDVAQQSSEYRTKVQCGRSENMIAFNKAFPVFL